MLVVEFTLALILTLFLRVDFQILTRFSILESNDEFCRAPGPLQHTLLIELIVEFCRKSNKTFTYSHIHEQL